MKRPDGFSMYAARGVVAAAIWFLSVSVGNTASSSAHYSILSSQIGGGGGASVSNSYSAENVIGSVSGGGGSSSTSYAVRSGFASQLNQPPSIQSRTINLLEDQSIAFTLEASDPENDPLTFTIVDAPAKGSLTGTAPNVTYQPDPGYTGLDILRIKASDGETESAVAVITFNVGEVNDPPVATALSVSVPEDGSKNVMLSGTDPENDPLTFEVTQTPSHGSLSGQAPNLLYTPAPNYHGSDAFQFKASDGFLESAVVSVSITVTPVNDAPGALAQNVSTSEDIVKNITLVGSDIDGDALSFVITRIPANGTLTGQAPALVYQPNANYNGSDRFDFKVSDGLLESQEATVSINIASVNDAPTLQSRAFNLLEDQSVQFILEAVDADQDDLSYVTVRSPSNGSISGTAPHLTYQPNAAFSGTDTLQMKVSDGQLESSVATITFNVGQVNDAPVATDQTVGVIEDTVQAITLSGSDADGDPLTFQITVSPTHGTLNGDAPNLTYQPDANYHGADSFSFTASDGILDSPEAIVTMDVSSVNDHPVAQSQTVSLAEDGSKAIQLAGTDVDGDTLTFLVTLAPAHGTLSGQAPALTYQPDADFNGSDSFKFKVTDGSLDSEEVSVLITVTPLNDPPIAQDQAVTLSEDTSKVITLTGSDPDGDALTFVVVQSPGHGSLTGQAPVLTYQPESDYHGSDSFRFKTTDGIVESAVVTVTLEVTPVNDAPFATAQAVTVVEDASVHVVLTGGDVDGDTVTFRVSTSPSHGSLIGQLPNITYTPDPDYQGADTFGFVTNDDSVDSLEATVSIDVTPVNDPPNAVTQSISLAEDTSKNVVLTGSDPDGDALTYQIVQGPGQGTLSGQPPNLLYEPVADYSGADSFSFKVSDGVLASAVIVVNIDVTPVNDAPTIQSRTIHLSQDQAVNFGLEASDPEKDPLTYVIVLNPAHGTLSGTAPNLRYQPDAGYVGNDTMTAKVSDGQLESGLGIITFNVGEVNDPPVASSQSITLAEDASKPIVLTGTDPENDPLTFTVTAQPMHGVLTGQAPALTYQPFANYYGPDSLRFKVSDGSLESNEAHVVIDITSVNDTPEAQAQAVTLLEDGSKALSLQGSDVDGDPLSFTITQDPGHGTLSGQAPNVIYQPDSNFNGTDSFLFKVSDGAASSAAVVVTLHVTPQNDAPVAVAQTVSFSEDTSKGITLSGTDMDGDILTFQIVQAPAHGNLSGQPPTVTFVPAADYNGADSFTFKVSDGNLASTPATVTLDIAPVNDAPTVQSRTVNLAQDQSVNFVLEAVDVELDTLTYSVVQSPAHGTISGTVPNLTYLPQAGYSGTDRYQFRVSDGLLDSAVGTITFNVGEVNDPPVGQTQTATIPEDNQVLIILSATDPEDDPLTYQVVTNPSHGTLSGQPPTVTYTPSANFHGTDGFTFKASDGFLESAETGISITMTPVNDAPVATPEHVSVAEDTGKAITLSGSDADGDALTYQVVQGPTQGSLSGQAPALSYQPNPDFFGADSFTFKTSDGSLESSEVQVQIDVTSVNDAPTALAQTVSLSEDGSRQIMLTGTDPDGDALTFQIIQSPSHGTLTGQAPLLTYRPTANYHGVDRFTFNASDGTLQSMDATLSIEIAPVNDAPAVQSRSINLAQDQSVAFVLDASDVDGDALSYIHVLNPANGTLTGTAPNLTYQPNAGFVGTDTLQLKVSDGQAESHIAFITFNVGEVNDAPTATGQTVQLAEDGSKIIVITGTDPENDPLTFTVTTQPTHGTLTGQAPTLTYQPFADYYGPDSFGFKVSDGFLESNEASVVMDVTNVNDVPKAQAQTVVLEEDQSKEMLLTGSDVDGDTLGFRILNHPEHGSLTGVPPALTYQPEANYHGTDSIVFIASDGSVDSAPASILIQVTPVNDTPIVQSQSIVLSEDISKEVYLEGSDVDGDAVTFVVASGPDHGTLSGSPPSLTYLPDPDYHGEDQFEFKATDGTLESESGTIRLQINPVNDVPVGVSALVTLDEDQTIQIKLNASDVDGDELTFRIALQPEHGNLVGTAPELTFIPEADYFGSDLIKFRVSDGQAESDEQTITLFIAAVNDAPNIQVRTIHLQEDQSIDFTVEASDVEGDALNYEIVSSPSNGSLSGLAPNMRYQPNAGYFGTDSFEIKANDGQLDSAVARISFNIGEVNDVPVAQSQNATISEDSSVVIILTANDPEEDPLTYRIISHPSQGTLSGQPPVVSYRPDTNYNGLDSFTFAASDGFLESEATTLSLEITPVNDVPVASAGTLLVDEDTSGNITLTGFDVEGDPLSFRVTEGPQHGTVTGQSPTFSYRPAGHYHGTDQFSFVVSDGLADSEEATVSIRVTSVNDRPTASPQTVILEEDSSKSLILTGADADGDTLAFEVTQGPGHGVLSGQGPELTYQPNANYNGPDRFLFKASDGTLDSVEAEISIEVTALNDPPTAQDITLSGYYLDEIEVPSWGSDPEGEPVAVEIVGVPLHGRVFERDGVWYYEHTSLDASEDRFTFRVSDGELFSGTHTVTVTLQKAVVSLQLEEAGIVENQGSTRLILTRESHLTKALVFDLSAAPGSRVTLPNSLTIQAGSASGSVEVVAVDNALAAGDKTVQLFARHAAFHTDPVTLNIQDNEVMTLKLSPTFDRISENGGESRVTASVNTPPLDQSITLTLSATPGNQVAIPSRVVIPAGSNKTTFLVRGNDNNRSEGDRTVRIQARNQPSLSASLELQVLDDDVSHSGRLTDGWIAGATVFFDANRNRQLDAGEPNTITNEVGQYWLNLPLSEFDFNKDGVVDALDGTLVGLGGKDITTGLTQTSVLLSSPSATVISPLTTLVVTLLESTPQISESEAVSQVQSALNIEQTSNILHFDAYKEAEQGNPSAVSVMEATAKVQDTVVQVESFLNAASSNNQAGLGESVQRTLAKRISLGQGVNLENTNWVADLIDESARDRQVDLNPETTRAAAQIVSVSNQQKQAVAGSGQSVAKTAEEMVRIQAFSQTEGSSDLVNLGKATKDAEELRIKYGGQNFQGLVQKTAIGALNAIDLRSGTFSFNQATYQIQENGRVEASVVIQRTLGSFGPVDLVVEKMGLIAQPEVDFDPALIPVHFDSLEVNKTLVLDDLVKDDALTEPLETLLLTLSVADSEESDALIGDQSSAVLEILDNDSPGQFQFSVPSLSMEEQDGVVSEVFIKRSAGSTGQVTLLVESVPGSTQATWGVDYAWTTQEIVFPAGVLQRMLPVRLINDDIREPNETLTLRLRLHPDQSQGAELGANQTLNLRILNDDLGPAPVIQVPADQSTQEDEPIGPLAVFITDADNDAEKLTVEVTASNPLLPVNRIVMERTSDPSFWLLTAMPVENGFGNVTLNISVHDGIQTTTESIQVEVAPVNDPPQITGLSDVLRIDSVPSDHTFEANDVETDYASLIPFYTAIQDGQDVSKAIQLTREKGGFKLTVGSTGSVSQAAVVVRVGVIDADGLMAEKNLIVLYDDDVAIGAPRVQYERLPGNKVNLTWEGDYDLYQTDDLRQPFQLISGATSPYVINLEDMRFYIVRPQL